MLKSALLAIGLLAAVVTTAAAQPYYPYYPYYYPYYSTPYFYGPSFSFFVGYPTYYYGYWGYHRHH